MDAGSALLEIALKMIGSVAGAILALVFQPPKNRAEFVTRSVFSILSGLLFGDVSRDYFHWTDTVQMTLAASAVTAMLSWFVMGTVVRVIGAWKPPSRGE